MPGSYENNGDRSLRDAELSNGSSKSFVPRDFLRADALAYKKSRGHEISNAHEMSQEHERSQECVKLPEISVWVRDKIKELWSTFSRADISEQERERSQERRKSQQLSVGRGRHALKALAIALLLFTSGTQEVQAKPISQIFGKKWKSPQKKRGYVQSASKLVTAPFGGPFRRGLVMHKVWRIFQHARRR